MLFLKQRFEMMIVQVRILMLALDEVARLRTIIINKYKIFLKKEKRRRIVKEIKNLRK